MFSPFPLKPIYCSLEERDKNRRIIYKLLDKNFGSIWRYYLKVKYIHHCMQHRVFKTEVREEEKVDLNASKVKEISRIRSAYCKHGLELIKFYYLHGQEKTFIEIELDTFRYTDDDGNIVIEQMPKNSSILTSKEDKEPRIPADDIDISQLPSRSKSKLDLSDIVTKLEEKSKV